MGRWFAGLGLATKGEIPEEEIDRKACMVGNQAHGAAMELVATAAYHAMYEFGLGDMYEIILADPREGVNKVEVGLMTEETGYKDPVHVTGSPQQRAPDLVLHGAGEGDRYWIELKSWRYNDYLGANHKLKTQSFPRWNGMAKSTNLKYTQNAHRQHFLDYAATKDELLDDYWGKKYSEDQLNLFKPGKHRTWVQIWEAGARYWRDFEKNAQGRWELKKKQKTLNVATPWISAKTFPAANTPQFRALQKYLTSAPSNPRSGVFKTTLGYAISEHEKKYQEPNVSANAADFYTSTVAPFNLTSLIVIEAGQSAADTIKDRLWAEFEETEMSELYKNGSFTQGQVEQMRENITEQMLTLLGPFEYLMVRIPLLSYLEDKVGDLVLGEKAEEIQKFVSEFKLPEFMFEAYCEEP
jgi:hypothetical protein